MKRGALLTLLLFTALILAGLILTACEGDYTLEVSIDNEEILDIQFEHNEGDFLIRDSAVIYVETAEKTYVVNGMLEFVRSNKSTLTKQTKKYDFLGIDLSDEYTTIRLGDDLYKKATDSYAKELKKNLDVLEESEFVF